jgi:CrcB protein
VYRFLLVCLGGALGSGARYLVSTWAARVWGPEFPRGTLIVNVTGSFLLGSIQAAALATEAVSPELRLFLGAGIMGGYTTYSSFNYETLALVEQGAFSLAAVNLGATVLGCLAAGLFGIALVRWLAGT